MRFKNNEPFHLAVDLEKETSLYGEFKSTQIRLNKMALERIKNGQPLCDKEITFESEKLKELNYIITHFIGN